MIFVTLGTQDKDFKRLLNYLEKANIQDEIIVQAGHTKFKSDTLKIYDYLDSEVFLDYLKNADLIITHGGVGNIMQALSYNKKVIACARLSKYHEHHNDHQVDIVDSFSLKNYILKLDETIDINELLKKVPSFIPATYQSNNHNFIKIIEDFIAK